MILSDVATSVFNYSVLLLFAIWKLLRRLNKLSTRLPFQQASSLPVASSSNVYLDNSLLSPATSTTVQVSSSSVASPANTSSSIGDSSSILPVSSVSSPSILVSSPPGLINSSSSSSRDVVEGSSSSGKPGAPLAVVSILTSRIGLSLILSYQRIPLVLPPASPSPPSSSTLDNSTWLSSSSTPDNLASATSTSTSLPPTQILDLNHDDNDGFIPVNNKKKKSSKVFDPRDEPSTSTSQTTPSRPSRPPGSTMIGQNYNRRKKRSPFA